MAARGPGDCLEREGRVRHKLTTALFQRLAPDSVETRHICTCGTDAERKRLPPIVETRIVHPDGQVRVVDVVEAGGPEQLDEVAGRAPASSDSSSAAGSSNRTAVQNKLSGPLLPA